MDKGPIQNKWEQLQNLGRQKDKDTPKLYYEAVPVRFYKVYKTKHKFQDLVITDDKTIKPAPIKAPKPDIRDLKPKSKQIANVHENKKSANLTNGPQLAYPGETPTYRYRSPGQRNS